MTDNCRASVSDAAPDRNSPEALAQRLKNAEELLTKSLNLIAAMQPVITAAEAFFDHLVFKPHRSDLAQLGLAVASYKAYVKANATIQSKARRPTDHRGSQGEADQAQPETLATG